MKARLGIRVFKSQLELFKALMLDPHRQGLFGKRGLKAEPCKVNAIKRKASQPRGKRATPRLSVVGDPGKIGNAVKLGHRLKLDSLQIFNSVGKLKVGG